MRRLRWLLAGALILGGCQRADERQAAERWLKEGERKLQARDYTGAADAFTRYVNERNNLTAALPEVYRAYVRQRALEPAYEFLVRYEPRSREIKVTVDRSDYYRVLGNLAYQTGKVDEAFRWYEKAIQLNNQNHEAFNNYAYALAEQGKELERALKLVNHALALRPSAGSYYDTRGWIYYKLGRYEEALKDLRMAVDIAPQTAELRYHLAAVYAKLGRQQDALVELEKALALDPSYQPARELQQSLQGAKPEPSSSHSAAQ